MGLKLSKPVTQLIAVSLFTAMCATVFGYLWVNSGGKLPGISSANYRLTASFPRVANLVYYADVMVAGVKVGKVQQVVPVGNTAQVTMDLTAAYPMHQGATAQIRAKTLVEESFVEIADGSGPALPSGSTLPLSAGKGPTQLNDVLLSLSGQTRQDLATTFKALGASTEGEKQAISDAMTGLGGLGRGGHTALDALSAQSEDLKQLTGNTATLLTALNTQRGQIAQLVQDANTLTTATSDGAADLQDTMRALPPVLASARDASDSLTKLGTALRPVARNLRDAGPDLSASLDLLPDVSRDLRGLLPDLDSALRKAPDTLTKVPDTANVVRDLIPQAKGDLADLNPILGYLQPYSPELSNVLGNFAQTLAHGDANGRWFYALLDAGTSPDKAYKGMPVNTQLGPLKNYNPYPFPGQGYNPGGQGRPYTRLQKEGPG